MEIRTVLAQVAVRNARDAERWYSVLFGRSPNARPMDGLVESHFNDAQGVQVWVDNDRAGRSTMVLGVDDLDVVASQLSSSGITDAVPTAASSSRILEVEDPDGNRIVFTGN